MLLSGACPHYRTYRCGDGLPLAVATLEPRFWHDFLEMLGLPELEATGYDPGEAGLAAAHRIQDVLATESRTHWLEESTRRGLPVSPVATPAEAADDPLWAALALTEKPGVPPSRWFLPPLGGLSTGRVPEPGEHTQRVLAELNREE
jgi:alpha-methylacyl-CoA racemase